MCDIVGKETAHGPGVEHLQLNITEEVIVDLRRNSSTPDATNNKGQTICSLLYFGVFIDSRLNFGINCEAEKKGSSTFVLFMETVLLLH